MNLCNIFFVALFAAATTIEGFTKQPLSLFGADRASTKRFLSEDPHAESILFVECGTYYMHVPVVWECKSFYRKFSSLAVISGFGSDAHGQNSTKAAGKNESTCCDCDWRPNALTSR